MGMDSDIVGAIVEFAGIRHRVAAIALAPGGLGFQALLEESDGGALHHVNLSSAIVRVLEYAPRPSAAIRIEAERMARARNGDHVAEFVRLLAIAEKERNDALAERDQLQETIKVLEDRLRGDDRRVPRRHPIEDPASKETVSLLEKLSRGDGDPTRHGG